MAKNQPSNRHVNHLLHTLRGEQFRQAQNLRGSRAHLSSSNSLARNKPTLPIDLTSLDYDCVFDPSTRPDDDVDRASIRLRYSGPTPPKSWTLPSTTQDVYLTEEWRAQALALLYKELGASVERPRVPSLTLMCFEDLIAHCTLEELREDIIPWVPPHLRRVLIRHTTIHAPIPNETLFALYEDGSHADGEIIIVGPNNAIPDDYFIRAQGKVSPLNRDEGASQPSQSIRDDWDADDHSPALLRTVAIVSTRLPMATILSFPPTLTHLALIRLSVPINVHRLPQVCPLLEFLDLSYNTWLEDPAPDTQKSWNRIHWERWSHMRVLGLRDCPISEEQVARINRGRWDDILIVR